MKSSPCLRPFRSVLAPATLAAVLAAVAVPSALRAGPVVADSKRTKNVVETRDEVSLNQFEINTSYVGKSDFEGRQFGGSSGLPERSYGRQDEFHINAQYSHRFQLTGRYYLRLGAAYERFDFGTSLAPIPTSVQSIAGVVAVEYIVRNRAALFISSKPGVYYSNFDEIGTGNFDAPTVIAGVIPLARGLYGIVGARVSILAQYPVIPIVGLKWNITDRLRLDAIPPEPRLVYEVSDNLEVFAGGEILGESYKRGRNPNARPQDQRFNEGVIDYSEYRVGGGFTYKLGKAVQFDVSGGYVPRRTFDYYRGEDNGKRFRLEGAPYAKVALAAQF